MERDRGLVNSITRLKASLALLNEKSTTPKLAFTPIAGINHP
jgi:hypothetical protein